MITGKRQILFLLVLISPLVWAQKRLSIGVTGGFGSSNAYFSKGPGQLNAAMPVYTGGIIVQYMNTKNLGTQFELRYAEKGFAYEDSFQVYKRHTSYIDFAMMSHFVAPIHNIRLFANLGPQLSFPVISGESLAFKSDSSIEALLIRNRKNEAFQFGLTGGFGLSFNFPFGIIQAEGRYYQSFTNIIPPRELSFFQMQALTYHFSYLYTIKLPTKTEAPPKE